MIIRYAKQSDIGAITRLSAIMADYHHAIDPYYRRSETYADLQADITSRVKEKNDIYIVAEDNEKIIGFLCAETDEPENYVDPRIKKIGIVHSTFVEEQYRKQGIAHALFEFALQWFDKKHVQHVELSVDARNTASIAVWKKLSFAEYKLRMRMDRK